MQVTRPFSSDTKNSLTVSPASLKQQHHSFDFDECYTWVFTDTLDGFAFPGSEIKVKVIVAKNRKSVSFFNYIPALLFIQI